MSTWVVRAGKDAAHFGEFQQGSYVAIGWSEVGDISPEIADDDPERRVGAAFADAKPGSIAASVGQIRRFLRELSVGDDVVTFNVEDTYLLGQILSAPAWRPDLPLPRVREVLTYHAHRRIQAGARPCGSDQERDAAHRTDVPTAARNRQPCHVDDSTVPRRIRRIRRRETKTWLRFVLYRLIELTDGIEVDWMATAPSRDGRVRGFAAVSCRPRRCSCAKDYGLLARVNVSAGSVNCRF
jgi:hypothetical protein